MFSAISYKLEGGGRRKWNSALESFTTFYVLEQMKNWLISFYIRKKRLSFIHEIFFLCFLWGSNENAQAEEE